MKRYVLLKIHLNEIYSKRFDDLSELKKSYESSEDFPGKVAAEYDLEKGEFIDLIDPHGEASILKSHLDRIRAQYIEENRL
ncbi:hypothetical protein [Pedobacter sp. BMA]|uniref:hypothetical protein n=1 Tax=Pedobacter sp. BMA TaxID=1663685 RepID=UPI0006493A9C|nr:hypothetical protein [Pedobacter sp. BMA]KLT64014.1 hypothetical protein AB669_18275 [Pedobacter sp. BMA]